MADIVQGIKIEHNKPKLYYIKIRKEHFHQGVKKVAERIITTHDTRIMPKYFKDRKWEFAKAVKA